ncbi:MAG: TetR/AcrR family transcriptional regulator [Burkholderiales bacterium]
MKLAAARNRASRALPRRVAALRPRADSRAPQVLAAAAEIFARKGFEATSIRDIVREVGMLPGSLYAHFDNKECLLLAVYEEGVRRISTAVEVALDGETEPWRRLEVACAAHLESLASKNGFARVVVTVRPQDVPQVGEKLARLREGYEELFRKLLAQLPLPKGVDRRAMRLLLLGALNWAPGWFQPERGSAARVATGFIALLRRGAGRE